MKFSFSLITRGRSHEAILSMMSLLYNVKNKAEVEIIVVLDDDDRESIEGFERVKKILDTLKYNIKIDIVPRMGYGNMHHYQNKTFRNAQGEFLIVWSDDHFCTTKDWDEKLWNVLEKHRGKPVFIHLADDIRNKGKKYPAAPGISKKWLEVAGYFSRVCSSDVYIYKIAHAVGVEIINPDSDVFSYIHFQRKYKKLPHDQTEKDRGGWQLSDTSGLEDLPSKEETILKLKEWKREN